MTRNEMLEHQWRYPKQVVVPRIVTREDMYNQAKLQFFKLVKTNPFMDPLDDWWPALAPLNRGERARLRRELATPVSA